MISVEEQLRQQYNVPDGATLLDKTAQIASLTPTEQFGGLANFGFVRPDGTYGYICKVAGNHIYFKDDLDGQHKMIDTRWIQKGGVLRPTATRHQITIERGGLLTYRLKDDSFTLDFGSDFVVQDDFAVADIGNGLTAKLWTKAGKFEKWITGTGHPNLPTTPDGKHYVLSIPMSGLPARNTFTKDFRVGEFFVRQAKVWRKDGSKTALVKQQLTGDAWIKLLPVEFFEDGVDWETDATIYYAGAGDGYVESDSLAGWVSARTDTDGAVADYTSNNAFVAAKGPANFYVDHLYLPTDMTGVGTVSSAFLSVYALTKADEGAANSYAAMVQTSQASTSSLVTADIDNVSYTEGSSQLDLGAVTTSAHNTLSFTGTGIGWISSGIVKVGLLIGHDINDVEPTQNNSIQVSTSEATGTSQDPYISATESESKGGLILSGMRRRLF